MVRRGVSRWEASGNAEWKNQGSGWLITLVEVGVHVKRIAEDPSALAAGG